VFGDIYEDFEIGIEIDIAGLFKMKSSEKPNTNLTAKYDVLKRLHASQQDRQGKFNETRIAEIWCGNTRGQDLQIRDLINLDSVLRADSFSRDIR
jgi:hypothetical protein